MQFFIDAYVYIQDIISIIIKLQNEVNTYADAHTLNIIEIK